MISYRMNSFEVCTQKERYRNTIGAFKNIQSCKEMTHYILQFEDYKNVGFYFIRLYYLLLLNSGLYFNHSRYTLKLSSEDIINIIIKIALTITGRNKVV